MYQVEYKMIKLSKSYPTYFLIRFYVATPSFSRGLGRCPKGLWFWREALYDRMPLLTSPIVLFYTTCVAPRPDLVSLPKFSGIIRLTLGLVALWQLLHQGVPKNTEFIRQSLTTSNIVIPYVLNTKNHISYKLLNYRPPLAFFEDLVLILTKEFNFFLLF